MIDDLVTWRTSVVKPLAGPNDPVVVEELIQFGRVVDVYENGIEVCSASGLNLAIPHGRYEVIEHFRKKSVKQYWGL